MATEIERKFLLNGEAWRSLGGGMVYRQGYISSTPDHTVRVRVVGDQGFLTLKGSSVGLARLEYEYPIPVEDAEELLQTLCQRPLIEKTRYKVPIGNVVWEIDEFMGDNQGLILAEVELQDVEQAVDLPDWIGAEVTGDPRYYNSNLVKHPYSQW